MSFLHHGPLFPPLGYKSWVEGPSFTHFNKEHLPWMCNTQNSSKQPTASLGNRNLLYHISLDYLKPPFPPHIVSGCTHETQSSSTAHLALKVISTIMYQPKIQGGDSKAFYNFAIRVHSLVVMLQPIGPVTNFSTLYLIVPLFVL